MPRRSPSSRVLLVAMPWARLEHPSIQLGLLKAILDGRGIPCRQLHLYLDFVEHTAEQDPALGPDAYDEVATRHLVGDWIFAVPPFVPDAASADPHYLGFLEAAGEDPAFLAIAASMRKAVPSFLKWAVEHIVRSQPVVVGFTTTFGQTVASLVTALLVKRQLPGVTIVFGGAHCDGAMGEALFRGFPWIDVVVRGEAEPVFGELVESLLKSETPAPRPGLCFRSVHGERITPMAASVTAPPDTLPFVEYDDYFERLDAHRFAAQLSSHVSIPFESSRGCWWGEKHHCSFCGLNGSSMTFRRFDPGRVFDELVYLARRYQRLNFNAADNILDRRAFDTLVPRLIEASCDFRLFYEVKANLRKSELAQLRAAGVMQIQPGLESLVHPPSGESRKGRQRSRIFDYSSGAPRSASRCTGTSFTDYPETRRRSTKRARGPLEVATTSTLPTWFRCGSSASVRITTIHASSVSKSWDPRRTTALPTPWMHLSCTIWRTPSTIDRSTAQRSNPASLSFARW